MTFGYIVGMQFGDDAKQLGHILKIMAGHASACKLVFLEFAVQRSAADPEQMGHVTAV